MTTECTDGCGLELPNSKQRGQDTKDCGIKHLFLWFKKVVKIRITFGVNSQNDLGFLGACAVVALVPLLDDPFWLSASHPRNGSQE